MRLASRVPRTGRIREMDHLQRGLLNSDNSLAPCIESRNSFLQLHSPEKSPQPKNFDFFTKKYGVLARMRRRDSLEPTSHTCGSSFAAIHASGRVYCLLTFKADWLSRFCYIDGIMTHSNGDTHVQLNKIDKINNVKII